MQNGLRFRKEFCCIVVLFKSNPYPNMINLYLKLKEHYVTLVGTQNMSNLATSMYWISSHGNLLITWFEG